MRVAVLVTPKSGKDQVAGWVVDANGDRELHVRVTAAPEKGRATKAACKTLAAFFGVSKSSVECVRGDLSRHKMVEIESLTPEQLEEAVAALS